ncbi:MAG TPA: hypothetical protein PKW07_05950 [Syntrophorhabdaceae bacterium]|nr:hypothetical protein [Syntrophorhabdaceae bacterium]
MHLRIGDGKVITTLTIVIHETRNRIDLLFDELDEVVNEFESKAREFEERLDAFVMTQ